MPKFVKKPIVIEATQFLLGEHPYPEGVVAVWIDPDDDDLILCAAESNDQTIGNMGFGICTLEGWFVIRHGDWIATGIDGEKHPIKPHIFEATYTLVQESDIPLTK